MNNVNCEHFMCYIELVKCHPLIDLNEITGKFYIILYKLFYLKISLNVKTKNMYYEI